MLTASFHVGCMDLVPMRVVGYGVQHGSPSLWDALGAAACGLPSSGAVAPMRRCTVHSMRPFGAAVVWLGTGMRWHRGQLGRPAPRAPETWILVPCRCHRVGAMARCGIGVT